MRYFAGELKFLQEGSEGGLFLPDKTPVNMVYICGALTEFKTSHNGRVLTARVADPTGVFKIFCGKDRAYCSSDLIWLNIPSFVIIYGKVSSSKRNGSFDIEIIPETVREISRQERDSWILGVAAATIKRLEDSFENCGSDYGKEVVGIVKKALLAAVPKESCEISPAGDILQDAGERILKVISENSSKRGVLLDDLYLLCESFGLNKADIEGCIKELVEEGELYLPSGGYVKIL